MKLNKTFLAAACAGLPLFALGACGGGGSSAGAEGHSTASSAAIAAYAQARKGSFREPPSSSPRPQPGKNVWFIPLSSDLADFDASGAIHAAAKKLGWKLTQIDGKFSPDAIVTGIRQAIADHADGIITYVVDCPLVSAALDDAHTAGIKVVSAQALDCSDLKPGAPSKYDAKVVYSDPDNPGHDLSYKNFIQWWGRAQALAIINGTGGKAKLIDVLQTDAAFAKPQDEGLRAGLVRYCPQCRIVDTVKFTGAEIGDRVQQKVAQSLTRHPDANAIASPYDAVTPSVEAGARSAGRLGQLFFAAGEGQANTLDAIREHKGIDAAVGLSLDWDQWAMLDALNRLFHGERPGSAGGFSSGNGYQVIDARSKFPPPGTRFQPSIDFRTALLHAWGLE